MDPSNNNSFGSFSSGMGTSQGSVISGSGDVMLGSVSAGKKNKKWWIGGGVFVFILAVVIAVLMIFSNRMVNNINVKATFEDFYNIVKNVPEEYGEDLDGDELFLFSADELYGVDDLAGYLEKVESKYNELLYLDRIDYFSDSLNRMKEIFPALIEVIKLPIYERDKTYDVSTVETNDKVSDMMIVELRRYLVDGDDDAYENMMGYYGVNKVRFENILAILKLMVEQYEDSE